MLEEARRGVLPGMVRTGVTFADAAAKYLRYIEHDRGRKPSTLRGYRSAISAHLLSAFGPMPMEDVTGAAIERWMVGFAGSAPVAQQARLRAAGQRRRRGREIPAAQ